MSIKKQIIVIDWVKGKLTYGKILKLTLNSNQRRILRGKRISDCNQEIHLQLPREGKLKDGDILHTTQEKLFVEIVAQKENLIEISAQSKLDLIKTAYHLGNRHLEVEIYEDTLLTKSDSVVEELLINFKVNILRIKKKFFPETGAFNHD